MLTYITAAPPVPQKQFTDEELKQQYGIHMATRLQSDETGKEAKWADIDDDEDDWAPETVEWMDGTKTTVVAAAESKPLPATEEPKSTLPQKDNLETAEEDKEPAPLLSTAPKANQASATNSSGTKTILKPGSHSQLNQQRQTGGTLKKASDKPTLVAKAQAPVPTKSPWAPLPPVEKVSPIQINPPFDAAPVQSRFGQRDPHGLEAPSGGLPPAKEIAADDFSRSWREERTNRELFNSRSGRYEPVNDTRRGSFMEGGHRHPAVLQRPIHGQGPAEPSAAFQTSRTGPSDSGSWGRRRNSSNVSGSSGRRMSFSRMPEGSAVLEEGPSRGGLYAPIGADGTLTNGLPRHALQTLNPNDRTASPSQQSLPTQSPSLAHVQPASPYGSVASSGPGDLPQSGQTPQGVQDPVLLQQQAMKERIERARLAKQRQIEEEARKEAEKRERLKAKLASIPVVEKPQAVDPVDATTTQNESTAIKEKPAIQSPPKPPLPPADGEVAQYGLMKVHPSHTVKKLNPSQDIPATDNRQGVRSSPQSSAARLPSNTHSNESQPVLRTGPDHSPGHQLDTGSQRQSSLSPGQSQERQTQSWHHSAKETYQGWGAGLTSVTSGGATSVSNVWGPPLAQSKDRALGNGVFDNSVNAPLNSYNRSSQPPQSHAHGSTTGPGPIAPPSRANAPTTAASLTNPLAGPFHDSLPPNSLSSPLSNSVPDYQQSSHPIEMGSHAQQERPRPIGPPAQQQRFTGAWGALAADPRKKDAEIDARRQANYEKMMQSRDPSKISFQEVYREGAQKTKNAIKTEDARDDEHSLQTESYKKSLQIASSENFTRPHGAWPTEADDEGQRLDAGTAEAPVVLVPPATSIQLARGSRFFPRPQEASLAAEQTSDSDSPPPPETYETHHPAFAGDTTHPKVNLPVPKARVKLPPVLSPTQPEPQPVLMPPRPTPVPRLGSQPIVQQMAWQERINSLFAPKTMAQQSSIRSPPSTQVLPVSSASKAPLDVVMPRSSATVSLPTPKTLLFATDYDESAISKITFEEDLIEDREFGSLPRVCLPKQMHANAHLSTSPVTQHRPNSKFIRSIDATSAEPLGFSIAFARGPSESQGYTIMIRLPGMAEKSAIMPRFKNRKPSTFSKGKRAFSHRGEMDNKDSGGPSPTGRRSPNSKSQSRKGSANFTKESKSGNVSPRTGSSSGRAWNKAKSEGSTWSKPATPAAVH